MGYTHFKHADATKKNSTNNGAARHMIAYHGRGGCGIHKPKSHSNPQISMEIAKKSPAMPLGALDRAASNWLVPVLALYSSFNASHMPKGDPDLVCHRRSGHGQT